jgi:hypothetical protein
MASIVVNGDTSGAITLQSPSVAGTNTITLGANTGTAILDANTPAFRNRIINGAMVIDQRNAGAEVNPAVNTTYYLDRWQATSTAASKFKIGQNAGAVTPPTGYINYLGCTSLSAYTAGTSETFSVIQRIEGLNVSDLAWGTASASTVTLSFWVYSSLTGTFGGSLRNNGNTRSYPFTYTISSANTWTQASVTIAGDTSGTWLTTNGIGILVTFSIGTGATLSGTAGAWAAADYRSATGAVSVVGTNTATWYVTGVQLEKGSTATSFDYRPYGTELALCQRYFTKSFATTVAPANSTAAPYEGVGAGFIGGYFSSNFVPFPVTMRAVPTMTYFSSPNGTPTNDRWQIYDGGWANASSLNGSNITVNGFQNSWAYGSATLKGAYYISGHFTASIEL